MLNKHHHIPHHQMFFTAGGRIPLAAAEGMWKLIRKQPISEGEVFDMFFETKFGGPARAEKGNRYYSNDRFGEQRSRFQFREGEGFVRRAPDASGDDEPEYEQPRRSGYERIGPILRARRRVLNDDDSMPPYDPNAGRPSIGNKRPRGNLPPRDCIFIDNQAGHDGGEEEEEEEQGEELSDGFVVSDEHLSDDEGCDGNQFAMRH